MSDHFRMFGAYMTLPFVKPLHCTTILSDASQYLSFILTPVCQVNRAKIEKERLIYVVTLRWSSSKTKKRTKCLRILQNNINMQLDICIVSMLLCGSIERPCLKLPIKAKLHGSDNDQGGGKKDILYLR